MGRRQFMKGDWVIYCKTKYTRHPGQRAKDIAAAANGDGYYYLVDKFWVVSNVLADGKLLLRTRRGKQHRIDANDSKLRMATLWDRLRYRARFKQTELSATWRPDVVDHLVASARVESGPTVPRQDLQMEGTRGVTDEQMEGRGLSAFSFIEPDGSVNKPLSSGKR